MRWGSLERLPDCFQHTLEILDHVDSPEPENPIAVRRQLRRTCFIRALSHAVLPAIELDHELLLRTREIGDAPPDRMLSSELPARQPIFEAEPERAFRVGGIAPKPACKNGPLAGRLGRRIPHLTLPSPPPRGRRGNFNRTA